MSGFVTYTVGYQLDDLLTESWERLGKSPAIMTGDVAASVRRSLHLMLIDWTNRGVPLWQVDSIVAPLLIGEPSYVLPPYIADVLDVYVTLPHGIDRLLGRVSRANYAAISNKKSEGPPSQMWVNRQAPSIQVVLYPVPDQALTMTMNVLRQPQDTTSLFQTADAPLLWSEALAAGLSARMAEKFAPDRFAEKVALAEKAWTAASGEERERAPFIVSPEWGLR